MRNPTLLSPVLSPSRALFAAREGDDSPNMREVEIPVLDTPPLTTRERIVEFLLKRDTVISEAFLAIVSFIIAWRCIAQIDGKPVAPLTSSTLLQANSGLWFWALVVNGLVTAIALGNGLATGNTFRYRSFVSLFSSLVWSGVAVASMTSGLPAAVYSGYIVPCVMSWFCAIVLMLRAERAKALKLQNSALAPVVVVPLDGRHFSHSTPFETAPTAPTTRPHEES